MRETLINIWKKNLGTIENFLVFLNMEIERTNKEILIRLSSGTDLVGLQRILDYLKYREIASKSEASQKEIDELSSESKSSWWNKNKDRFIK